MKGAVEQRFAPDELPEVCHALMADGARLRWPMPGSRSRTSRK